jgi:hypothetical protein
MEKMTVGIRSPQAEFQPRLPDRDVEQDKAAAMQRAETTLKTVWRARLEGAKRLLGGAAFVSQCFDAAVSWRASDLLVDVPLLPGRLFARIAGYPIQDGCGQPDYLQPLPGLVRREQFAHGELRAAMLPSTDRESFAYWMFAKATNLIVLTSAWGVAEGHWLWDHVRVLDDHPAEVAIVGERARSRLNGQGAAAQVVLCEAYRVCIDGEVAELTDHALAWSGVRGDAPLILVPDGEQSGAAVHQCSSYLDGGDHGRGGLAEQDRDALASLIHRLRAHDPTEALRSLIGELNLENYPNLQGHTFSLQVGSAQGSHDVRLVG